METEMRVYNTDTMGPVVSLYSVKWIIQELVANGVGEVSLVSALEMVDRIREKVSLTPLVRLRPDVSGKQVEAVIVRFTFDQ